MNRVCSVLGLVQLLLILISAASAQVAKPQESDAGNAACCVQTPSSTRPPTGTTWIVRVDPRAPAHRLSPALLGVYDLDGVYAHMDRLENLRPTMQAGGITEWRVGLGRWEMGTYDQPATGPLDLGAIEAVLREREWFVDRDGTPATLADTLDDSRYSLDYARSVIDCALDLGATPWFNIDLMPRALALNRNLRRDVENPGQGGWYTFTNGVSDSPPADPAVFAAAVEGVVKRIVEGSGLEPGRAVRYFELWNEPDLSYAWDRALDPSMERFFQMVGVTLARLDEYRRQSNSPRVRALRFGLGSFAMADSAARCLEGFDAAGGLIPLDFISFHGYSDNPLDIVDGIRKVAAARAATRHYQHVELALPEWGRDLDSSKQSRHQTPMEAALHAATVITMGAAIGLTHAHRSLLWDPFPDVGLGLLDNAGNPRPVATAYALLAHVIKPGAMRLPIEGAADGGLEGGAGACLVSRHCGRLRAIVVNRTSEPRSVQIIEGSRPAHPRTLAVLANQGQLTQESPGEDGAFTLPAQSIVLAEM